MSKEKQKPSKTNPDPFSFFSAGDEDVEGAVDVMYGIHTQKLPLAGLSVKDAREKVSKDIGVTIDPKAVPVVIDKTGDSHTTEEVDESYVLAEGQQLTFNKPSAEKGGSFVTTILNKDIDITERVVALKDGLRQTPTEEWAPILGEIIRRSDLCADANFVGIVRDLVKSAEHFPVQPCTVAHGDRNRFACVAENGQWIYPYHLADDCPEPEPGDQVLVDSKGLLIVDSCERPFKSGVFGVFVRKLDEETIEVKTDTHERIAIMAHRDVMSLDLEPGATVCYHPGKRFALFAVDDGPTAKHRFIKPLDIPDVAWDRDVANMHPSFELLLKRTRTAVFSPENLSRWNVRPMMSLMLSGPPGTGKTHHIKAFIRSFYDMVQERLGHTVEQSRILQVGSSELLSMWLGESEKLIDRLFDDLKWLASEKLQDKKGKDVTVPVVAILEEADALSHNRADDGAGGAYNRIMGTLLKRLDNASGEIHNLPIIFLCTTNKPQQMDAAMMRRLARMTAHFGRLDQEAASQVLKVTVPSGVPMSNDCGGKINKSSLIKGCIGAVWEDESKGVLAKLQSRQEMSYFRRDFITPAVLDSAFQSAVNELAFGSDSGTASLTPSKLTEKVTESVDNLMKVVNIFNIADYVAVPEGDKVSNIKPIGG